MSLLKRIESAKPAAGWPRPPPPRRRPGMAPPPGAPPGCALPAAAAMPPRMVSAGAGARVLPRHEVPHPAARHLRPRSQAGPHQPGRGTPPDRGDLQRRRRRGGPGPHARRARPHAGADHRRDRRPRSPRAAAARRVHHRGHGQRATAGLHRAGRQARAHEPLVPERRPRDAHHRPHHQPHRTARRRVQPHGRCAPHRRLARQRHHPAALARRPGHHDPQVRGLALHGRRPHPLRHGDAGDVRLPEGLRRGAAQRLRLGRHRLGQDDHAQRPLLVHPQRRAHRDHRGRRRAAAPPGARRDPRVAPAQHRGQGRHPHPRAGAQLAAHAARPHHRRARSVPARPSTCSRP